jgi:hypothetical protein
MADINKDGILDIVNSKPTFAGLMLMFPDGFELTIKSNTMEIYDFKKWYNS